MPFPTFIKRYWYFVIPILWMGCLFYFSTDVLSAKHTGPIIEPLVRKSLRFIRPQISNHKIEIVHILIRKLGHVSEYALLAIFWVVAFRKSGTNRVLRRVALLAAICSIGYAMLDEWHQTFTHERAGSALDVLIDAFGVLMGLALMAIWSGIQARKKVATPNQD